MKGFSLKKNTGKDAKAKSFGFSMKKSIGSKTTTTTNTTTKGQKIGVFGTQNKIIKKNSILSDTKVGDDDDDNKLNKKIEIGSIDDINKDTEKKRKILVINQTTNNDSWITRRKRQLKEMENESISNRDQNNNDNIKNSNDESQVKFGLNVMKRHKKDDNRSNQYSITTSSDTRVDTRSLETKARDALLSGSEFGSVSTSDVIAITEDSTRGNNNIDSNKIVAPPTEDSYKRIPVNKFGAAMLRGMGWDGKSKNVNKNSNGGNLLKINTGRKNYPHLGLGAKPSPDQIDDPSGYILANKEYSPFTLVEKTSGSESESGAESKESGAKNITIDDSWMNHTK
ncbi:hypothetical protein B5S31_g5183 [[Candida] boidinii]|nr:hypothetical protein B5S31_g5183 [[Candida] boidinii]OWB81168.1 hypothetical protein B5S32_g5535 [[Candida] boidinii]